MRLAWFEFRIFGLRKRLNEPARAWSYKYSILQFCNNLKLFCGRKQPNVDAVCREVSLVNYGET